LKKIGISFLIGTFFGGACLFVSGFSQKEINSFPPPFPINQRLSYSIAQDTRFKIAFWTSERLTSKSLEVNANRSGINFFPDEDLNPLHRSTLQDYRRSGFDRGHLAAAANARFSREAIRETFKLSNVCPQNPNLNQGFWNRLETHIRTIVPDFDYVDVVTGPLFLPTVEENGKKWVKFEVIGENNVAVPTHLFKFISAVKGSIVRTWCYVVPNDPVPLNTSFDLFLVPTDELERMSGLSLKKN